MLAAGRPAPKAISRPDFNMRRRPVPLKSSSPEIELNMDNSSFARGLRFGSNSASLPDAEPTRL
jgi:hypothetical protein